jgi:hypothetical protein
LIWRPEIVHCTVWDWMVRIATLWGWHCLTKRRKNTKSPIELWLGLLSYHLPQTFTVLFVFLKILLHLCDSKLRLPNVQVSLFPLQLEYLIGYLKVLSFNALLLKLPRSEMQASWSEGLRNDADRLWTCDMLDNHYSLRITFFLEV